MLVAVAGRKKVPWGSEIMKKKSQIKLFESLAVLVVFFFLLVFGISFYFVLQKASINRQLTQQEELKFIQLVQKVSTLPELECSEVGIQLDNCIDILRLKTMQSLLVSSAAVRQKYYDIFGFSRIVVEKIYPEESERITLIDQQRSTSNNATAFDVVQVPLALYNPLDKSFSFGVLEVRRYA